MDKNRRQLSAEGETSRCSRKRGVEYWAGGGALTAWPRCDHVCGRERRLWGAATLWPPRAGEGKDREIEPLRQKKTARKS
jgi:hypothetical protein